MEALEKSAEFPSDISIEDLEGRVRAQRERSGAKKTLDGAESVANEKSPDIEIDESEEREFQKKKEGMAMRSAKGILKVIKKVGIDFPKWMLKKHPILTVALVLGTAGFLAYGGLAPHGFDALVQQSIELMSEIGDKMMNTDGMPIVDDSIIDSAF